MEQQLQLCDCYDSPPSTLLRFGCCKDGEGFRRWRLTKSSEPKPNFPNTIELLNQVINEWFQITNVLPFQNHFSKFLSMKSINLITHNTHINCSPSLHTQMQQFVKFVHFHPFLRLSRNSTSQPLQTPTLRWGQRDQAMRNSMKMNGRLMCLSEWWMALDRRCR